MVANSYMNKEQETMCGADRQGGSKISLEEDRRSKILARWRKKKEETRWLGGVCR